MAYIFPVNPYDGQIYPLPAIAGSLQYQWNAAQQVWLIYSPLGVQSVTGILPIVVTNGTDDAVVSIKPATINNAGSMSATDKAKLDRIPENVGPGTVTEVSTGAGLIGGTITTTGTIAAVPATTSALGSVIVGQNIDVSANGLISIPTARFGVTSVSVGPGLVGSPNPITAAGTISAALATTLTVGSVRVGRGLNVASDGTLSVGGSLGLVNVLAWGTVGVSPAAPYLFTLREGYNVSSIEWLGTDPAPRVRIYFANNLQNAQYGVFTDARSYTHGGSAAYTQEGITVNYSFKDQAYFDLSALVVQTLDYRVNGSGTNFWNDWSAIAEFDFMVVDTARF